jgi:hypothetical protein
MKTTPEEFLKWRLIFNEQTKTNIFREARYDNELGPGNAGWKKFGSVFERETHTRIKKTKSARPNCRQNLPPIKFMIMPFLNWQFVLLTSKVDGEMPMRGRENT